MNGADVSVYQPQAKDPNWWRQYGFGIIQVFNEHGGANPIWREQYDAARAAGIIVMVYGWAIAGADNLALGRQLKAAVPDADGYWDDHEIGGRPAMPSTLDVINYLSGIGDPRSGYYSNGSDFIGRIGNAWWYANPSGNRAPIPPLIVQTGTPNNVDTDVADDAALRAFVGGSAPKPKRGSSMYQVYSQSSQKVWKFDNATKNIVALLAVGPDHDEVLTRAAGGVATYGVANDLLVVVEAQDALRQQGRPASDINTIDFN